MRYCILQAALLIFLAGCSKSSGEPSPANTGRDGSVRGIEWFSYPEPGAAADMELVFSGAQDCFLSDMAGNMTYYTYDEKSYPTVDIYSMEQPAYLLFVARLRSDSLWLDRIVQGAETPWKTFVKKAYID